MNRGNRSAVNGAGMTDEKDKHRLFLFFYFPVSFHLNLCNP